MVAVSLANMHSKPKEHDTATILLHRQTQPPYTLELQDHHHYAPSNDCVRLSTSAVLLMDTEGCT